MRTVVKSREPVVGNVSWPLTTMRSEVLPSLWVVVPSTLEIGPGLITA